MDNRPLLQRYMGRKFVQSNVLIALATALLLLNKIPEGTWATVVLAAFGGYALANVWQDRIHANGSKDLPPEVRP